MAVPFHRSHDLSFCCEETYFFLYSLFAFPFYPKLCPPLHCPCPGSPQIAIFSAWNRTLQSFATLLP